MIEWRVGSAAQWCFGSGQLAQTTRDITETPITAVENDELVGTKPSQASSGVRYSHPDPEREKHLMSLVDETWPDIEETIHFLRDN